MTKHFWSLSSNPPYRQSAESRWDSSCLPLPGPPVPAFSPFRSGISQCSPEKQRTKKQKIKQPHPPKHTQNKKQKTKLAWPFSGLPSLPRLPAPRGGCPRRPAKVPASSKSRGGAGAAGAGRLNPGQQRSKEQVIALEESRGLEMAVLTLRVPRRWGMT